MSDQNKKQQVVELLKSIETGESKPVASINPKKYIQHNLTVADGLQGFLDMVKQLPPDFAKVNTVRVFQDGDTVFTHTAYDFGGPKAGFDVFRFEDGNIVEHWDNLQDAVPANPSGHSMLDGSTEVKDLEKTEQNKTLVRNFVEDILINGKMEKFTSYFNGDNYTQHNPQIADGPSGLSKAIEAMVSQGIVLKFEKIHKVFGEGNFVLVISEGNFAGQPTCFYDLFRVENGKLAEHWDTLETIPPASEWKNKNGKF